MERDKAIKLLESKIEDMVRLIITERNKRKKKSRRRKAKRKEKEDDTVSSNDSYKKQYKEIQKALDDPAVNATGVMSKALGIDLTKDDAARSYAFKKKNRDPNPNGKKRYHFKQSEVTKIFNNLP